MSSLADLFNQINPNVYPAFAFAWLELISHKEFMPHLLLPYQLKKNQAASNLSAMGQSSQDSTHVTKQLKYKDLIVHMLTFLKQTMIPGHTDTNQFLVMYYEATLRIITVIYHDYPDFLSDFHFNFVNSLPDHCI